MTLPYFYIKELSEENIQLDEDTSKHVTGVLRMKIEDKILLTDGKGTKAYAVITDDNRKRCVVKIISREAEKAAANKVTIAISLVKNSARFEWFLEKATEIGVQEIIPLICQRTEKEKFRYDRLNAILISAMLQSQQCWLPQLHEPALFEKVVKENGDPGKYIAHCLPHQKQSLIQIVNKAQNRIILIGPEGDFTQSEIDSATANGFLPVTLGNTRLRTETAGMVAATLLCVV